MCICIGMQCFALPPSPDFICRPMLPLLLFNSSVLSFINNTWIEFPPGSERGAPFNLIIASPPTFHLIPARSHHSHLVLLLVSKLISSPLIFMLCWFQFQTVLLHFLLFLLFLLFLILLLPPPLSSLHCRQFSVGLLANWSLPSINLRV